MSNPEKDRVEGKIDQTKGRVESAWGELTGDEKKKAEGMADKAEGTLEQAKGKVGELLEDAKEKFDDVTKSQKKERPSG